MNIYGNNPFANRLRRWIHVKHQVQVLGETAEGWTIVLRQDNALAFIEPKTGKLMKSGINY